MVSLTVKRTRKAAAALAGVRVLCLHLVLLQPASAQNMRLPAPDRDPRCGPNCLGVDVGVLAAAGSYARQVSPTTELGFALSGGAQAGFMLVSGELTGDAPSLFVELLSGAVFVRRDVGERTELESGVRLGWLYHTTEYETTFRGVYVTLRHQVGVARVGPSVYWGRVSEESGRSGVGVGIVPLTVGFRWSW